MDKSSFQKFFVNGNLDRIQYLYDKFNLTSKSGKDIVIGEFLTPDLYEGLRKAADYEGIIINIWEFYEGCERKLCVLSEDNIISIELPIHILKITNKSKFSQLCHRDYLGALMSLDIKREKFADLIVKHDCAYVPVMKEFSQYIKDNLNKISNSPCDISILEVHDEDIPRPEFEKINAIITSMRIDCVLSSIINKSRAVAVQYLDKGNVLVNYIGEHRKERLVDMGDIITVRGYGKYKIADIIGKTQKDRIKVLFHKFV
ncbi:RNA-binding protein YlmH, contains S4-like domain [Hathewaya proteolytica DSM 3090]|uniref:RNA-binding protein YlmH, contains S4-like domain n=1 Tax=Hathewaya proteolytica DSM 3090 TaxID=1121331 RepID=A0A1M6L6U8_9CLOT|nr:YlmH/Sll1252 family protein [Hathewaya proteolytica]SHJ66916.1 RNA-binding protein YlmH, contains S4-like domain [Hathewaya proteolytica DSM 3090]